MAPVLLSRSLDTVLGVLSGFLAYYLHETHPRTALPAEQRLLPLLKWKWTKSQSHNQRARHLRSS